jgi:hypothetical protein
MRNPSKPPNLVGGTPLPGKKRKKPKEKKERIRSKFEVLLGIRLYLAVAVSLAAVWVGGGMVESPVMSASSIPILPPSQIPLPCYRLLYLCGDCVFLLPSSNLSQPFLA